MRDAILNAVAEKCFLIYIVLRIIIYLYNIGIFKKLHGKSGAY
jgi:hypothetical protein